MKKIKRSARQLGGLMLVLAMFASWQVPRGQSQNQKTKSPIKSKTESLESDSTGRIAFASDRTGNFEIYIMNPDGGGLIQITDNPGEDLSPTWSPDGTRLAFSSNRDGNTEIYVVSSSGGPAVRLTNNPAEDIEPAWSPAGATQKIAFVSHRDGNDEVYVMNTDGAGLTNLTNNPGDDNGVAWDPSATMLAFASNRDGDKFEIYRMTSTGATPLRLTNNGFNDVSPAWPSEKITFQTDRDGNDEIYTMNVDGTSQARITNNTFFDLDPARAPDGAIIAFVSNRDAADNLEVYSANADGSFTKRLTNTPASDVDPAVEPLFFPSTLQFAASTLTVSETQNSLNIIITRTGDTSAAAVVDVSTASATASDRSDFSPIYRTLTFAPGETSKTITLLVINDVFIEPDETLTLTLSNATGATLGTPSTTTITITSDDAAAAANPIDTTQFFVRQHYLDFLNREPDAGGLAFWSNQLDALISQCPDSPPSTRANCVLAARANISVAFFLSIEFQQSGYFVIRLYQTALNRLPTFREFLADVQETQKGVVIGQPGAFELLAANRRAFLDNFVDREEFQSRYAGTSNTAYVNALFANAGVDPASEAATRDAVIAGLNNGTETHATALLRIVETGSVFNALYNRALVLMQYFGYLRRNPSDPPDNNLSGFNFWLDKLNSFSLPGEDMRDPVVALARIRRAQMIEAFLNSSEYRQRFGP